jgi:hypothetical protein
MPSDSRSGGNTRRWRARRQRWQGLLPLPCPRCLRLIQPWDAWDLGHRVDLVDGGDDLTTSPEHAACNRQAGGRLGATITNHRHNTHTAPGW